LEGIIQIRQMRPSDVDALLVLEEESLEAAAWTRQAYEDLLSNPGRNCCLVAEIDGEVVGFACFRTVDREAELLNLMVLPQYRRIGVGTHLFERIVVDLRESWVRDVYLEVRHSNIPAMGFYRHFGFEMSGRRPAYYPNPPEDALTFRLRLSEAD